MAELRTEHEAPLWGVSAEFTTAAAMLAALEALAPFEHGRLDAYSPTPLPEAAAILRQPGHSVYPVATLAIAAGAIAMMGMCLYATGFDYVFDIGGRPRFSWPSFVIPTLSFAMLAGTLAVFFALMLLNRLPRLNHPAFNIPDFTRSTQDRFFLAVESGSDAFDPAPIERILATLPLQPTRVSRVPR